MAVSALTASLFSSHCTANSAAIPANRRSNFARLQEKRGYRVTEEDDRKVIRDGRELVNSLWIEDEEGTVVRFIFP